MTHRKIKEPEKRRARHIDTARRWVAAAVGFIPVALLILEESKDVLPAELAAAATGALLVVSRVLSSPVTQAWIAHYAPWLEPGEVEGGGKGRAV